MSKLLISLLLLTGFVFDFSLKTNSALSQDLDSHYQNISRRKKNQVLLTKDKYHKYEKYDDDDDDDGNHERHHKHHERHHRS